MNQSPVGIGIVGTGFGQKVHIPAFEHHHRTQVVAVYHHDLATAQKIATQHQIPHAVDTVEAIANLPDVEAVSISTPPFLHYEMAKTVLKAKKHLLLEKPTTLSVESAQDLHKLAQSQGVVAAMDFEFRFVPAWQRFQELLADNYVGEKRFIKIDWLVPSRSDPNRAWNWYSQKEKGGGVLGAIGSHAFDYIAWLFGDIKRLSARLSTAISERRDPTTGELKPVDADDTCLLMLELADGTPCQVSLSSVAYQGRGHWVEVYGDRATLILGSSNQKDYIYGFTLQGAKFGEPLSQLEIPQRLEFPQTYPDGRIAAFMRVVDAWVDSIENHPEQPTVPTLREGVYSQLLMDLTHQSHTTNNWVEVISELQPEK
ncbi:Gfo/Idh/MocA family oxidoreductase [Roseofilum reptotaenium CS-1145]|uniref:Oxidoreductase n=1 Tax=Roseofilum reptotaenium AO1-A TaxID=1925591 RepID=A0A1L9QQM6_9CYAN|nr:Gfo/Idh/MocA family oxidoreductase [Roseofilum reptotaenium]MDB9516204.1 Gfo/Idh/MocA family oxidoreductase [Roseofilum reptotaenium CS-1145]OJJ24932.1 oxidoreductase [Roseofilum reptotaenium AO1-A]